MSHNTENNERQITQAEALLLKRERDLLGNLLGEILIAEGVMTTDAFPSVPLLLMVGSGFLEQLRKGNDNGEV